MITPENCRTVLRGSSNDTQKMFQLLSLPDEQQDYEIAYWFLKLLNEGFYKFKRLEKFDFQKNEWIEVKPPQELSSIRMLSDDDRKEFLSKKPDFYRTTDIKEYCDSYSAAESENNSNVYWLKWAEKNINEGDLPGKKKFSDRILEIEKCMSAYKMSVIY